MTLRRDVPPGPAPSPSPERLTDRLLYAWILGSLLTCVAFGSELLAGGESFGRTRLVGAVTLVVLLCATVASVVSGARRARERSREELAARVARQVVRDVAQLRAVDDVQGQVDGMRAAERARRSGATEEGL